MLVAKCKNVKKHVPRGFTRHHRRPESIGGDSSDRNISVVLKTKHEAWTELFDNLPAVEVARLFKEYWREFNGDPRVLYEARRAAIRAIKEHKILNDYAGIYSDKDLEEVTQILEDHRLKAQKFRYWLTLFGGQDLETAVKEVNDVWLDPDYRLVIDVHIERIGIRRSV